MDRLERLVNLVAALIDAERPLSRDQLWARVGGYTGDGEAARRNFERDKDLLRQMGLPLLTEPLDRDRPDGEVGYRIPRDRYELPDPGLDGDELAALRLAASAVQVEGVWGADATAWALRKLAGASSAETVSVPATEEVAALPAGEVVAIAFGAVAEQQRLRFTYHGEPRLVDPWRLSFRRGHWYLSGWDHGRGEDRRYRLDRVEGQLAVDGPPGAFTRPEAVDAEPPPPWLLGDEPLVEAQILVDADQARWALAALGDAAVAEHRDDGALVFQVPVTNRDGLRSFVLGFLDHAEILAPPELRQDLVAWLEGLQVPPAVAPGRGS